MNKEEVLIAHGSNFLCSFLIALCFEALRAQDVQGSGSGYVGPPSGGMSSVDRAPSGGISSEDRPPTGNDTLTIVGSIGVLNAEVVKAAFHHAVNTRAGHPSSEGSWPRCFPEVRQECRTVVRLFF